MTHTTYPGDQPPPVIRYRMPEPTNVEQDMLLMAGELVSFLVNIEGDTAVLIVEAPVVDKSMLELMAPLTPLSQPHGSVELFRTFQSGRDNLPVGAGNLHVVVTGLQLERYGEQSVTLLKTIHQGLDLVGQAWIAVQVMKRAVGIQLSSIDPLVLKKN